MKRHVTDALQLYLEVSAFSEKHDAPRRILLSCYLVPDPVMHEHEGIHECELGALIILPKPSATVGTDW